MILGLSLSTFTTLHMVVSLAAIGLGVAAMADLLGSRRTPGVAALFLLTTAATSIGGLLFLAVFWRFGIGHAVGALSLLSLAPTLLARYRHHLAGPWRSIYAMGAVALLYLNVFIGVFQAFAKIAPLRALAAVEPLSLLVAHLLVLALFIALGALAFRRFRPPPAALPRRTAKHAAP